MYTTIEALEIVIEGLEREVDMLSELPQQKEIKAAISHIKMAEDFIADLVFPTEEE